MNVHTEVCPQFKYVSTFFFKIHTEIEFCVCVTSLCSVGLDPEMMKKFQSLTIIPNSQLETVETIGKGKDLFCDLPSQ